MAARYIAEWGGQAEQYRAIFETENCVLLANTPMGVPWGNVPAASDGGAPTLIRRRAVSRRDT